MKVKIGTLGILWVIAGMVSAQNFMTLPFADEDMVITAGWRYDSDPGDQNPHGSTDYALPDDSSFPVRATAVGRAIATDYYQGSYGELVVQVHDEEVGCGRRFSYYAHLKKESQTVPKKSWNEVHQDIAAGDFSDWQVIEKRGEVLGAAGKTGKIGYDIHLHHESMCGPHSSENRVDPYDIEGYANEYPGGPLFTDCGPDHLWTVCPPVGPGGGGGDLPVIYITDDITEDTTWEAGYVYVIQGTVNVHATLTLESGVIVKFEDINATLHVFGTLDAQGTAVEKIYFTSFKDDSVGGDSNGDGDATEPQSLDWHRLVLYGGGALEHVMVQYSYSGVTNDSGTLTISHSTFTENEFFAIINRGGELSVISSYLSNNLANFGIRSSGTVNNPANTVVIDTVAENNFSGVHVYGQGGSISVTNSTFSANLYGVITIGSGNSIEVHSSNIVNNTHNGISAGNDLNVNASYNWWGDASGPYHPTQNPNGMGDGVSDNVDFVPWLTEPAP